MGKSHPATVLVSLTIAVITTTRVLRFCRSTPAYFPSSMHTFPSGQEHPCFPVIPLPGTLKEEEEWLWQKQQQLNGAEKCLFPQKSQKAAALPSLCIRKEHVENLVLLLPGSLQKDYTLMLLICRCHGEPPLAESCSVPLCGCGAGKGTTQG